MPDPFIGEIRMFAGNFAPVGWALCNGQLLPISQNTALFSILGTTYGGNGQTTFALPDLRGRVPIHAGSGTGLSPYNLGESGGQEQVALTVEQLPEHTHRLAITNRQADRLTPQGRILAKPAQELIYATGDPDALLNQEAIATSGNNQPHDNRQPYLAINYIIALQGIFPSRS
jgi:microcystin-dependent protein